MTPNASPYSIANAGYDNHSAHSELAEDARELAGKRAAIVVLSRYPVDARPRRVADTLVSAGMSIDYICVTDGTGPWSERRNGLNLFRVPIGRRRTGKLTYLYEYAMFTSVAAMVLALRSWPRYDLVYVNNMPDVLVATALWPKLLGSKVILDLHDPMPELMATIFGKSSNSAAVRVIRWLEKWAIARADQVLTVNAACRQIFTSRSCAPDKIRVIMNSPEESIFGFRPAYSVLVRKPRSEPFVVMYHGSMVERNGVDLAVDAIERVMTRVPNVQLHLYGKTTAFLERVLASAKQRGLSRCVLYRGEKTLADLVAAINSCDVGIIPNHDNEFTKINTPTRLFEYLTLGKPVIAPRTPGIQDYFDEESLLYFQAGNAADLADQIEFVASNPQRVIRTTERGQQVCRNHAWHREQKRLLDIVGGLLQ